MRLFRLELKRILKSRRTLILLAIALLLSVAMAYLPISFEGINRPNEDGTVTELDGLLCMIMAIYTGHKMISGKSRKKKEVSVESVED